MEAGQRFQVAGPAIVADVIDGDTVIMNLDKGDYYALNSSAGALWHLVVAGQQCDEMLAALASRYGITPSATEIDGFIGRLAEHGLVGPREQGGVDEAPALDALPLVAWVSPKIDVYSDIRELLAFDPPLPQQRRAPS